MEDSPLKSLDSYGPDIAGVLIGRARIAERVGQLARGIAETYDRAELTILGTLTGSLIFISDLIRLLPMPVRLELVRVRSYPDTATSPQEPVVMMPPPEDLRGRHVLIVDDILDTGRTIELLLAEVAAAAAASVRTCVLLCKRRDDVPARPTAHFVGFDIDDQFVVGYGLDHGNLYRNLPDICLLARHKGGTGR
jgi:hypoxanthine phosphoribosyltransferase